MGGAPPPLHRHNIGKKNNFAIKYAPNCRKMHQKFQKFLGGMPSDPPGVHTCDEPTASLSPTPLAPPFQNPGSAPCTLSDLMAHGYNVLSIQRTNRRSPQVYVVTRFECTCTAYVVNLDNDHCYATGGNIYLQITGHLISPSSSIHPNEIMAMWITTLLPHTLEYVKDSPSTGLYLLLQVAQSCLQGLVAMRDLFHGIFQLNPPLLCC